MMFGPDGRLYAGATRTRQIVAYDAAGKTELVAEDVAVNDLAREREGRSLLHRLRRRRRSGSSRRAASRASSTRGSSIPNGVLFSPDQTLLYVSDYAGQLSWAFQIQPDGSLAHKQKYFYVHMPDAATRSGADGMARRHRRPRLHRDRARRAGLRSDRQVPRDHPGAAARRRCRASKFGGAEPRRALRHQRRQGLQAQDEGQRRRLLAGADQAGAAAALSALHERQPYRRTGIRRNLFETRLLISYPPVNIPV